MSDKKECKMGEFFSEELREVIKKSDLCTKTEQDFNKILTLGSVFLECRTKDDKENVEFYYNTEGKKPLTELRNESTINRLKALVEIRKLENEFIQYKFSINPMNLYYDRNYRIYIKKRDLYDKGLSGSEQDFLEQYKALIAHNMQKKYTFSDYYDGGFDLYKKNKFLNKINENKDLDGIEKTLIKEHNRVEEIVYHCTLEVNKSKYHILRWVVAVLSLLMITASLFITYLVFIQMPRKNAFIDSSNNYISNNYVMVIDSLQNINIKYLDKYQKYMLAVSYVKCENLTQQQKENILSELSIDEDEKIKDYWIYLGRLDTERAEDIAMQLSDNELLLYSYMTEKAVLDKDINIAGDEKTVRMEELDRKINEIAKQYEDLEPTE